MVIQHNLSAFNTNRQLGMVTGRVSKSSEKLSSGYKINRAADDAAGLSISEKMRKQIRGLQKASENIEDGISLIQVADGALNETADILQRMNELSIQAANGTNSINDRRAIQMEIDQLSTEIDRIANTTSFNQSVYPLKSVGYYYLSDDEFIPVIYTPPKPLEDIDISQNCININGFSDLSGYTSYVDADGKTHYVLGSGKYKINNVTDCVIDVGGDVTLADTRLENVTINCAEGTNLSVSNVTIDNHAYVTSDSGGIGAAVDFHGADNTLNCYGYASINRFYGGMDSYKVFTDSFDGSPYHIACAGIHVESGAELTINGTTSSLLVPYACGTREEVQYGEGERTFICSSGIGSNFHEDGGTIVINSGTIFAWGALSWGSGAVLGGGAIGGGNNTNITINGGTVAARGGQFFAIGGGDTKGDSMYMHGKAEITINGGIIDATSEGNYAAIGFDGEGSVDIYGGSIIVLAGSINDEYIEGIGIGNNGSGYVSGSTGTVSIHGGYVNAVSSINSSGAAIGSVKDNAIVKIDGGVVTAMSTHLQESSIAIGTTAANGTVNVYVDGKLTDASGTSDGLWDAVYTYNNPNTGTVIGYILKPSAQPKRDDSVWIQSTNEALKGLCIKLVDASMGGLFNGAQQISVLTETSCDRSIRSVSRALRRVSEYRSYFGAIQNRLEHAYQNNENVIENTTDAESRIRDTDMAEELVRYSNYNILSQSGQSMLAQANQKNQAVLSLIA